MVFYGVSFTHLKEGCGQRFVDRIFPLKLILLAEVFPFNYHTKPQKTQRIYPDIK
ncbi:MAG: hypothetical protein WDM90_20595 [Ferruginibacter sp.]